MTPNQQRLLAIALISFMASLFGLCYFISTLGYPKRHTLESELTSRLPLGSQGFEILSYNEKDGYLFFRVRCPSYGDAVGTRFEVRFSPDSEVYGDDVTFVKAIRRQGWEMITMVEYRFEDGELRSVEFLDASAAEGPRLEELAKQLDEAVGQSY